MKFKKFLKSLKTKPMKDYKVRIPCWWELHPCPECGDRVYLSCIDGKFYLCCVNARITMDGECNFYMFNDTSYQDVCKDFRERYYDKQ